MLFSLLKHHLDINITDTALKICQSLYFFTISISHGVENYFPWLWGMGISDAIFQILNLDGGTRLSYIPALTTAQCNHIDRILLLVVIVILQ